MRERRKEVVRLIVVALLAALIGAMAWGKSETQQERGMAAQLWFSWSPEVRAWYVGGFIAGFREGERLGCSYYSDKITPYLPNEPTLVGKFPKLVCLDALPDFTEPYFQSYVDAVTNYYTKYPRDGRAGPGLILFYLASPPGLTIDQIHTKLTGEPAK